MILFRAGNEFGPVWAINVEEARSGNVKFYSFDAPMMDSYHECLERRERWTPAKEKFLFVGDVTESTQQTTFDWETGEEVLQTCTWTEIHRYDLDHASTDRLTFKAPSGDCYEGWSTPTNWDSVYSPDGHHAAYVSNESKHEEIWVMNTHDPRSDEHQVTDNANNGSVNIGHPTWSPDGKSLIVATNATTGKMHLEFIEMAAKAYDEFAEPSHSSQPRRTDVSILAAPAGDLYRPVWVKYRDLPQQDTECQDFF